MSGATGGANLTLAEHYLKMGRPEQALQALQRADETQLDDAYYWYLRGRALHDQKQYAPAAAATRHGLGLAPEAIFLLYLLCSVESSQGNLAAAEEAILKALAQAPDDAQLLCRYAMLTAEAGQLDKAEQLLAKARQYDAENPFVAQAAAVLAYLRGDDKAAARRAQSALVADPDSVENHRLVGGVLLEQGRVVGAGRHLWTAARLNPLDSEVTGAARVARFLNHPLMIPLRPVLRFGRVAVWLASVATLLLLASIDAEQLLSAFLILYFVYAVYTLVVPRLLWRHIMGPNRPYGH